MTLFPWSLGACHICRASVPSPYQSVHRAMIGARVCEHWRSFCSELLTKPAVTLQRWKMFPRVEMCQDFFYFDFFTPLNVLLLDRAPYQALSSPFGEETQCNSGLSLCTCDAQQALRSSAIFTFSGGFEHLQCPRACSSAWESLTFLGHKRSLLRMHGYGGTSANGESERPIQKTFWSGRWFHTAWFSAAKGMEHDRIF